MSTSLLDVRGIGQATAKILAGQGITSAEDLAAAEIARIVSIQGFNELRAAQVIRDAKALFSSAKDSAEQPNAAAEGSKQAKSATTKKDKKHKQKKKKQKAAKSKKKPPEKKSKDKKNKKSKANKKSNKKK